MKKCNKIISVLMVMLIIIGTIPLSVFAVAPKNPWESTNVNDNVFLNALSYLGYNTSEFTVNGKYGSSVSGLSGIGYNAAGATGLETSAGKPNKAEFKRLGMCCASYASYVYFNYLPNVYGLDTSFLTRPSNPRSTTSWHTACESWVKSGNGTKIPLNISTEKGVSDLSKLKSVPIGSVLIFKDSGGYQHTGLYAGTKNGKYFQTNVGNSRGPEVNVIDGFKKGGFLTIEAAYTPKIEIPSDGLVGVKKTDDAGNPLAGAVIGIYSDSSCTQKRGEITTNASGTAVYNIPLKSGSTVYFKEISAPTGYDISSQIVSATVKEDTTTYASVSIVDNRKGKITATKYDDAGSTLGAGYVFGIYSDNACKNLVTTMTTGANSIATSGWLSAGTYYVKETAKPANDTTHKLNPTVYTVTVTKGGTTAVNNGRFVNDRTKGSVTVTKVSEDDKIEGLQFRLYGKADIGTAVDITATTNANGIAYFGNVLTGTYTVEEVNPPEKYEKPQSQTVTVTDGGNAIVTFSNTLKRGQLTVIKKSEDNYNEGVEFHLYGISLSGIPVDASAKTDKSGTATFNDVLIGSYALEEVNTAIRYIVPDSQTATIEWNKVTNKTFKNILKRGDLKITKTSEDGLVEGIKFHLFGTSVSGQYVDEISTTDKNGVALFKDLLIGSYTVEEVGTHNKYIVPDNQTATVEWNKVTNMTFNNILKRGDLKVRKTSEDGLVEGMNFHLYGKSLSGIAVDEYATTDKNGIATFKNILIGTSYTLEEVNTPNRYVVLDKQTTAVEWNKVAENTFHNVLKNFNVTVTKTDKETNTPQGDGTLAGAKYGIYKGNQLIDTYTTDKNGQFTTKYYICGNDWTIREIAPSEGYLLDKTSYRIGAEPQLYTVEYNNTLNGVQETVKKGKISVIKHCDDDSTQIETPEVGAKFEVFLKSAGSYDKAKDSGRCILVCDKYGYAETKLLPYGIYTVKQTKGWDGKELMTAFDVFVSEDGQTYRYLINNATFESLIEIVKKDIETGKIIPVAGIGFKVRNTDTGEYVVQHINYPTPTDIDTYYTDTTGKLMMPKKLPYGNYEVIEVQTCHGYVLDSKPVPFKVDGTQTVVTVEKHNIAQKGKITVSKSGEVFSSVTESDGIYQPVYSVNGLAGAVYEIYADKDIITLDGTLRYKKGELVSTVTTDKNGKAITEPLYLGKYEIKEVKAPYGMIINSEPQTVELVYAGQNVAVTSASADFFNDRQKAEIELAKLLELDELFGIGNNGEILAVSFGLYAAENIKSTDGKIVPKDALLEIVSCDKNGNIKFTTDIPVGAKFYVKEYTTDEHYIISDKAYHVTFEYAGQDTSIVRIFVNDGKAIENEIIRGSVVGKKVDDDGFEVCGALIGLFRADETEFTKENALMTCLTNEIGVFIFENVAYGDYVIREIAPPVGYVLNDTVFPIIVNTDKQVITVEIEDKIIVGSVQTTKVDAEYPENKLSGAVFEIYVDVDRNKEFNADIDKLVGEMTETELGGYCMNNLRYGGYFLHEKTVPEGFLKDDGYYYFEIQTDGETVIAENEKGVGFTNKPIIGNIEITKTDIITGEVLPNAGFRIKDMNGNVVAEGFTDENGIARFTLRYGKYTYEEFSAPEGYILDTTPHELEIIEDGQIIKVEMNNKPIVGTIEITKKDISDGTLLPNAGFRIKNENGEVVAEGYTDENGIAKFTLRYGKYTYEEFDAPEGYLIDTTPHSFEITENGQIIKAEMTNEKAPVPEVPDIPPTGDNSNIGFWIGLGAIAVGGLVACAIIFIKGKKDEDE